MMLDMARRQPQAPMLRYWRGRGWQSMRWAEFAKQVAAVAAFLRGRGIEPGDRVVLVSENRPEFLVVDTAIMAIGAVSVPTYTTNTVPDHAHILRDSGARAAIVSTPKLAERVLEGARESRALELLVCMDGAAATPPGMASAVWADALAIKGNLPLLAAEVEQIPSGRLACLIYTSGTGGMPRGVMLPHRAMLANRDGVAEVLRPLKLEGECYLSFLPMSHAYEHTVGYLFPSEGIEVVYSRGADRVAQEFQEIRPAIVTAVPRLFEVLRARMLAQRDQSSPLKQKLFDQALALGLRRMDGPPLSLLERLQDAVLERLVRAKVRARFGGRLVAMVSGGARLDPDLGGFFLALGLPVLQGYGQTEAGPVISVNLPWDNHRRSVGPPLAGVEARFAADGELLVRGELVMDGYWNSPDATEAALKPAADLLGDRAPWLHTGDVGQFVEGRIVITDRKRDFIKTLGGDMVSPAKLEMLLMAEPEIAQAVVAGEGKPGIVALVVAAEGMRDVAGEAVDRVNRKLGGAERIRRWQLAEPFTMEDGLLTPTMKIKRREVLKRFEAEIAVLAR
jgi:long-chain acyl-CoA synthetase